MPEDTSCEKKNRQPSSGPAGIPRWFVTYSDVITLLMTFFILLLTFANSEPEKFELMQQSLFGAGGSAGIVGHRQTPIDQTAILLRVRPPSSRLTIRGSEIPPMSTDPVTEAVGTGLQSLAEQPLQFQRNVSFDVSQPLFVDARGELTIIAREHLQIIATQMQRLPIELKIIVGDRADVAAAASLANYLITVLRVPAGHVAIESPPPHSLPNTGLRLTLGVQE